LLSLQGLALWTINLLNPLFLENVLHYDAWSAGLAVAPRGLGVVIALLAVGQLSRRYNDMRTIVCVGFLIGAYQAYRMSQWTLNTHESEVLLPIFLFGVGLGAIFPIVTALGVGQINRERIGFASSLFSMMVNTGAAAGIAIATNLLTASHRRHEARILAPVLSSALHADVLRSQAWLLAYNDVYRITAILLLLLSPWAFFLRRAPANADTTLGVE